MSASGPAVFLSYASQDAEVARRLAEALRASGIEVWFDQNELVGGDAWDAKIRSQIASCALFVPVISANTQARREGYFRLEWKLAAQRTHMIADGTPFLLPVVVDGTRDAEALVPVEFKSVQWTRLGATAPAEGLNPDLVAKFVARTARMIANEGTGVSEDVGASLDDALPEGRRQATPLRPTRGRGIAFRWVALIVAGTLAAALLAIFKPGEPEPLAPTPSTPVPAAAASAPGANLRYRDPVLQRVHDIVHGLDRIPADFALAEDLLKPILAEKPNDPEVATVAAEVAQQYLTRGFDLSETRRSQAQRLVERAVQLAPDSPNAHGALSRYLTYANVQLGRAEEAARRAIALAPEEPRFHRTLLQVVPQTRGEAAAEELIQDMAQRFPQDSLVAYDIARYYKDSNQLEKMERWFDRTIAIRPVAYALVWKAWMELMMHGDVAGMKAALDRIDERERLNSRVANAYYVHALVSGETGYALELLLNLEEAWMTDFDYTGPKSLLIGDLLRRDGKEELAQIQFEKALGEIRTMLTADPSGSRVRRSELLALMALGRRDDALASFRLNLQSLREGSVWRFTFSWWNGIIRASLLLGQTDQAVEFIRLAARDDGTRAILRNLFTVDPAMVPFKDDPRIRTLIDEPASAVTSRP